LPDYEYDETIARFESSGETFRATGRTVINLGWQGWEREDARDKETGERERGADGDGVPLEVTGTASGADLGEATIDTVTYVVGTRRYTQNVCIKLAETNVIDNTRTGEEPTGGDDSDGLGSGIGGCDTGAVVTVILAVLGFALSKKNR
jgi:hypothetical protein